MLVKVGNTFYNPNDVPIMIVLSDTDKANIAAMPPGVYRYCVYPDYHSELYISVWMEEGYDMRENKIPRSDSPEPSQDG